MTTARDFPHIYREMGIDTNRMGCIMLEVEPLDREIVPPADWGYVHDTLQFVNGFKPSYKPHITLLYGLMQSGQEWRDYVTDVLEGWKTPEIVSVDGVEMFANPGQEYAPVVLRMSDGTHAHLAAAHARLSFLPHINTFPTYKSHITIGYVKNEYANDVVDFYEDLGLPFDLHTRGLNYGR